MLTMKMFTTMISFQLLLGGLGVIVVVRSASVDPPISEPIVTPMNYSHSDTALQGFLAVPPNNGTLNNTLYPAVIILPDWDGVNFYEQVRATLFATEYGWVAFAADIYGADLHNVEEMQDRVDLVTIYRSNTTLFGERINAAVQYVKSLDNVDPEKVALIGYCFGGTGTLVYALEGYDDVKGVVSVHGGLTSLLDVYNTTVTPKVLVLSGGDDDTSTDIMDLESTLTASNAYWEITRFSNIQHAWTVWANDAYDAFADKRTWDSGIHFLQEVFGEFEYTSNEPDTIQVEAVPYDDNGIELQGYVSLPSRDIWQYPVPGVLILPDWDNVNDYEKLRATLLAETGYLAFVADIYGAELQDVTNETLRMELYTEYTTNIPLFLQRINKALETMKTKYADDLDMESLAIIGYCFGGTGVVQYAFSGAEDGVKVAVAYHGGLNTLPNTTDARNMHLVIESGGDDPAHGNQTILEQALNGVNDTWEISRYSNVVHGFTVWSNEDAYSVVADSRSWNAMLDIFAAKMNTPKYISLTSTPNDNTNKTENSTKTTSNANSYMIPGRTVGLVLLSTIIFMFL